MIPWLGRQPAFPAPASALAEPDGLLAAGGALSVPWLTQAYRHGIFPWFSADEPILWWSPSRRMVMLPGSLHVSHSLAKTLRNKPFRVSCDTAFDRVIRACAQETRPGQGGTWITGEMVDAYCRLHAAGFAHSFEVWRGDELVGGLYGVAIGRMFFGESMFHRVTDASKVAFVHMVRHLQGAGFDLIDCQLYTPHLARLGAAEIERAAFLARLAVLIAQPQPAFLWNYRDHHASELA